MELSYQSHVHLHTWCLIFSVCVCMCRHHFHDDTSHRDNFTCLILSVLLITPTDNKLIFHQNFVQFLSLTSCHVITQNILHHKYKSQSVYMILSLFHLPPILSTHSYLPKKLSCGGWSIKFQCNNVCCVGLNCCTEGPQHVTSFVGTTKVRLGRLPVTL